MVLQGFRLMVHLTGVFFFDVNWKDMESAGKLPYAALEGSFNLETCTFPHVFREWVIFFLLFLFWAVDGRERGGGALTH